jgi:hypothetical protein
MINISYREKLIKSIKEKYLAEAGAYRRRERAENLIYDYFGELLDALYEEAEAADDQFDIDYDKLRINGIELGLNFENEAINVYLLKTGANDKQIIDQLEDNGSEFFSKKHNAELSDDLLDSYLQKFYEESIKSGD